MAVDSKTLFAVADVFKAASQLDAHSLYSQQTTQIQLQRSLQLQYTLPLKSYGKIGRAHV